MRRTPGRDAGFLGDEERPDVAGGAHVRAAAQLGAEAHRRRWTPRGRGRRTSRRRAPSRPRRWPPGCCGPSVVTGSLRRMASLTMLLDAAELVGATALKCTKSKRRRSGATSEPACFTCGPSTWRSAAVEQVRAGVVAPRRIAQRDVDFGDDEIAGAKARGRAARSDARAAARRPGGPRRSLASAPARPRASPDRTPDRRPRGRTACAPEPPSRSAPAGRLVNLLLGVVEQRQHGDVLQRRVSA